MTKKDILKATLDYIKQHGKYPKRSEYKSLGYTRDQMRNYFTNTDNIKKELADHLKNDILDLNNHKFNTKIKKKKRYIITTAVLSSKIDDNFYKNLLVACKHYDAELIFGVAFPSNGSQDLIADPRLKDHTVIIQDTPLNDNIMLLGVKTGAKTSDPVRGKSTIGQRGGSLITFSPKQRLQYVPTGPDKLPNALMSTGAATVSDYRSKGLMVDLNTYKASLDHVLGAIIVEIKNDKIYHFRQIQADSNGDFVDLNTFFKGGKIANMRPEAIVLGDWHVGETDPVVRSASFDMIEALNPKSVYLHDVANFHSINPHEKGKRVMQAKKALSGELSLSRELDDIATELKIFLQTGKRIVVVASNHDEFLSRYLEDSAFVKHPYNYLECLDLAAAMGEGKNPLVAAMEKRRIRTKNLVWLDRNDVVAVAGITLSAHGDKGANGSKGTPNTLENAYIKCVVGHSHAPQIMRGVYVVGTSTGLNPHYGPGQAGSWMNTHCLVYPNGARQLINIIDGEWKL